MKNLAILLYSSDPFTAFKLPERDHASGELASSRVLLHQKYFQESIFQVYKQSAFQMVGFPDQD